MYLTRLAKLWPGPSVLAMMAIEDATEYKTGSEFERLPTALPVSLLLVPYPTTAL